MAIETRKLCDKCKQAGTDEDPVRTFTWAEEGGEVWEVELHMAHAEPALKLARLGRKRSNGTAPPRKMSQTAKLLEPKIRRREG